MEAAFSVNELIITCKTKWRKFQNITTWIFPSVKITSLTLLKCSRILDWVQIPGRPPFSTWITKHSAVSFIILGEQILIVQLCIPPNENNPLTFSNFGSFSPAVAFFVFFARNHQTIWKLHLQDSKFRLAKLIVEWPLKQSHVRLFQLYSVWSLCCHVKLN
jgi:hypothetical protein